MGGLVGQSWCAEFTWIDLHFGISTKRNGVELGHQLHEKVGDSWSSGSVVVLPVHPQQQ